MVDDQGCHALAHQIGRRAPLRVLRSQSVSAVAVRMRVQVDESWSYRETLEIDPARSGAAIEIADCDDTAVSDPDIGFEPWVPRSIDDMRIREHEI